MKSILTISVLACILIVSGQSFAAEQAPQEVIDYINKELVKWGVDPVIVKAVKEENAKKKTLEAIQAQDKKWKETAGVADYMKAIMESECGKHLQKLMKDFQFIDEIFVMDNLGANVAMSDKTSDYWQGDEEKFTECYKKGKGAIYISDVEFDESTQSYIVQASVPVKELDKETKEVIAVIGAICIGINIDNFK